MFALRAYNVELAGIADQVCTMTLRQHRCTALLTVSQVGMPRCRCHGAGAGEAGGADADAVVARRRQWHIQSQAHPAPRHPVPAPGAAAFSSIQTPVNLLQHLIDPSYVFPLDPERWSLTKARLHTPGQVNVRQPLTRYRLQKILNVREHDMLESDPPASLHALEEYAEGTASQLLQLQVVPQASMQMHMHS